MEWQWLITVGAAVLGFSLKVLYDVSKQPTLRIKVVSVPYSITALSLPIPGLPTFPKSIPGLPPFSNDYLVYRISVENTQKRYLNAAAENCIAWLQIDSASEPYQLNWVGELDSVTINVGDTREINLCGRNIGNGYVIAPTERGYFNPQPRLIGNGTNVLKGRIRITCRNGKRAIVCVRMVPLAAAGHLEVTLGC